VQRFPLEFVIPANHHDVSVITGNESAATVSGSTDAFRLAGLIRARPLWAGGRWIPLRQVSDVGDAPVATFPHG
jgi:hypothetical protein